MAPMAVEGQADSAMETINDADRNRGDVYSFEDPQNHSPVRFTSERSRKRRRDDTAVPMAVQATEERTTAGATGAGAARETDGTRAAASSVSSSSAPSSSQTSAAAQGLKAPKRRPDQSPRALQRASSGHTCGTGSE